MNKDNDVTLEDINKTCSHIEELPTHWKDYNWGSVEFDILEKPIGIKLNKDIQALMLDLTRFQCKCKLKGKETTFNDIPIYITELKIQKVKKK